MLFLPQLGGLKHSKLLILYLLCVDKDTGRTELDKVLNLLELHSSWVAGKTDNEQIQT